MQSHCTDQSDSAVACEQVCGPPPKDDSGLRDVTCLRLSHSGRMKKKGTEASRS